MTDGAQAEAQWRAAVAKVLKGADATALVGRSRDGLPVGPLYPAAENPSPQPWRHTGVPFGLVQRVEHPDPEEAGRQALQDVENGSTGLTLTFAGHPAARGFGLPSASLDAVAAVLAGVAIEAVTLRFEAADRDWDAPATMSALADRQGVRPEALDLDVGLDPLSHAARTGQGNEGFPLAVLAGVRVWRERGFVSPVIRADGRVHAEAGATEAQELAGVLSAGVAYLGALEPLGLEAARQAISFTLTADADQILTIAKLRAMRRLWARIEDACGLQSHPIRLHAETAWRMLARRDPWTNLLRNTIASAAAILGGVDSLGVLPFTSALGLPDAFARRLARNTPLVLLEEAHLGRVIDPGAGAGSIEALTEALCVEAWGLFQGLQRSGGLAGALASRSWQRDLAASRSQRQAAIAAGQAPLVGVTLFAEPGTVSPSVLAPSPRPSPRGGAGLPSWREAEAAEDTPSDQVPA